jgi:hypothetical protein
MKRFPTHPSEELLEEYFFTASGRPTSLKSKNTC